MNAKIKLFLMIMLFGSALRGAIGCKSSVYTPDFWDINAPKYENCSCPCANTDDHRGYCSKCGHYGRVDRGQISHEVLASLGTSLY